MGYPVREYRTTEGRPATNGFQGSSTKSSGQVLRFPADTAAKKGRRERMRQRKAARRMAPRVPHRKIYPGRVKKAPSPWRVPRLRGPLSRANRLRNRQLALAGLKFGLKFRGMLMRGVARWLLENYAIPWATRMLNQHPQPGWTHSGSWGNPMWSGLTNAHTTTPGTYRHLAKPGYHSGGDGWDGPPFSWMEIDTVTEIVNPITGNRVYDYHQIGKGKQGTGIDPRILLNNWWHPFRMTWPPVNPGANPWSPNFAPGPQGLPGIVITPDTDIPVSPMLDPPSLPIGQPQSTPQPMPRWLLPKRRPNPYMAPSEQTQWGPHRRTRISSRDEENPYFPWPDTLWNPRTDKPKKDKDKDDPGLDDDPETRDPPTVTQWTPDRNREYRREPNRRNKPPKRKVKERKIAAPKFVMTILNGITEFSDLLRALYKALPQKYQRKGILIRDQWKEVYKHWDEIDLEHAVRAVGRDQLEDMIFGRVGSTGGKGAHNRQDLIDKISRAGRKLTGGDFGDEYDFSKDPVDWILDRLFGEDT